MSKGRRCPIDYSHLSVAERLSLVEAIRVSIADAAAQVTPAQLAEYDRRWADFKAGRSGCTPWPVVKARLSGP